MTHLNFTLSEIANHIGAELIVKNDALNSVIALATLSDATDRDLSFLSNAQYAKQLSKTHAAAVIVSAEFVDACTTNALVMKDPYLGFAKAAALFDQTPKLVGVSENADVHESVKLGEGTAIGSFVSIAKDAVIGKGCQIHPGVTIGEACVIGDHVTIYPNATLYHSVTIGDRCILHASCVIGSDGFGFANDNGRWVKIPQLGSVVLEDNVEIGASTTIDRGAINDTHIGSSVIIDNQIQIGHNVTIKDGTAMAGGSAVAGSTTIGRHCLIGGLTAINGHIEIADKVMVTGSSAVGKSILEPGVYSSSIPATRREKWYRTLANLNRLDKLFKKLKRLEEKS